MAVLRGFAKAQQPAIAVHLQQITIIQTDSWVVRQPNDVPGMALIRSSLLSSRPMGGSSDHPQS